MPQDNVNSGWHLPGDGPWEKPPTSRDSLKPYYALCAMAGILFLAVIAFTVFSAWEAFEQVSIVLKLKDTNSSLSPLSEAPGFAAPTGLLNPSVPGGQTILAAARKTGLPFHNSHGGGQIRLEDLSHKFVKIQG